MLACGKVGGRVCAWTRACFMHFSARQPKTSTQTGCQMEKPVNLSPHFLKTDLPRSSISIFCVAVPATNALTDVHAVRGRRAADSTWTAFICQSAQVKHSESELRPGARRCVLLHSKVAHDSRLCSLQHTRTCLCKCNTSAFLRAA